MLNENHVQSEYKDGKCFHFPVQTENVTISVLIEQTGIQEVKQSFETRNDRKRSQVGGTTPYK